MFGACCLLAYNIIAAPFVHPASTSPEGSHLANPPANVAIEQMREWLGVAKGGEANLKQLFMEESRCSIDGGIMRC